MVTIQDDFHKHGAVCVSTDCWKRWTMGSVVTIVVVMIVIVVE